MKHIENRKIWFTALLVVGATLYILAELMELIDSFWSGMGLGFVVISGLRLVQIARYKNNDEYAKKITVANNDERNQFLSNKARSTAFYNSILLEAIVGIVLHIIGKAEIAQVILTVLCGQLIIYWVTYVFLKSKY